MSGPRAAHLAELWRHPIKSCGRERVAATTLAPGEAMPFDRAWALLHDAARRVPEGWAPCQFFQRGSRTPAMAAIDARVDEATGRLTLTHPDLPPLAARPDDPDGAEAILAWVAPLCPPEGTAPRAVVAAGARGMTDTDFPSVSLLNLASHRAVEERLGPLSALRWRCNLWVEGLEPWAEEGWTGRLRAGRAVLEVVEPIGRCLHTAANPATGLRDADTLGALASLRDGRRDLGIYLKVVEGGAVAEGDRVEPL